ncbi:hypothetical protein, partial [Halomonas sp. 707D4]
MIEAILLTGQAKAKPGEVVFASRGVHLWRVPPGVHLVSVVCVGRGGESRVSGGGGGALAYANEIPVIPGEVIEIGTETDAYFRNDVVAEAGPSNSRRGGVVI